MIQFILGTCLFLQGVDIIRLKHYVTKEFKGFGSFIKLVQGRIVPEFELCKYDSDKRNLTMTKD